MGVSLRKDMTVIPLGDGLNIVYAPLRGVAFYANDEAADVCKDYINGEGIVDCVETAVLKGHISELERINAKEPRESAINTSSNLVVILSQMCNLACTYCYAQESRSKVMLGKEQVKTAIDFVFSQDSPKKHFSFIGGGEPTLTWELLEWSISYIRSFPHEQNNVGIGITTNGTLLNEEKILFLKDKKVEINLSFEILPDVQNSQRCFPCANKKTFDVVDKAIRELADNSIRLSFRSTITRLNVKRMPEMVQFVIDKYPFVKKLHFEHVTSKSNDKQYYDDFIGAFIEAKRIGSVSGLDVYCSVSRGLDKLKYSFCRGEFCLTPSGDIVACHRISSKEENAFDLFKYAIIDEGVLTIDAKKKCAIEDYYHSKYQECASCFAKWHCAGSCPIERTVYSKDMRDLKCYFTKELSKAILIERLNSSASAQM